MVRPPNDRAAFRCTVAPEDAAAKLKIGRKTHDVAVLDTSRDGFSVQIPSRLAGKIKSGQTVELLFAGEHWQIRQESKFQETDDFARVGFSRVQELTKIEPPTSWFYTFVPKFNAHSDPSFLMYLMVAFLLACVALPGVGDSLGTAPKVRGLVKSVIDTVVDTIH